MRGFCLTDIVLVRNCGLVFSVSVVMARVLEYDIYVSQYTGNSEVCFK